MFTNEKTLFVAPFSAFCLSMFTDQVLFFSPFDWSSPALYNAYAKKVTALSFGRAQVPYATTMGSQWPRELNKNTSHLISRANDKELQNWPISAHWGAVLWQRGRVDEYKTVSNRNSSLYNDTIFYNTSYLVCKDTHNQPRRYVEQAPHQRWVIRRAAVV